MISQHVAKNGFTTALTIGSPTKFNADEIPAPIFGSEYKSLKKSEVF
jgi:hypothetical protein